MSLCQAGSQASQVTLVVKNPPANAEDLRDVGSIPGSGRSPGGGHGNPLQYSCLENPMDRGAWRATVHRVAKSQTQLKQLNTHTRKHYKLRLTKGYGKKKKNLKGKIGYKTAISSIQFSRSVVSDSLRPHESQHTRPPCLLSTPRVYPNSCPLSR